MLYELGRFYFQGYYIHLYFTSFALCKLCILKLHTNPENIPNKFFLIFSLQTSQVMGI